MTLQKLYDKRADLVKNQRDLLNTAKNESRELNADEVTKYEAMEKDFEKIENQIRDAQIEAKISNAEKSLGDAADPAYAPTRLDFKEDKDAKKHFSQRENYVDSFFNAYARKGKGNLEPQHFNALQEGTDSEGGYIVPEEFATKLIEILSTLDPIRRMATVISTRSDRNIPIEASEGSFAYIAEEGGFGNSDPSFGRVILNAYKAGGIIKVSEELLQDSFFSLSPYLRGLAARRYNALEETNFANGNGSAKPLGVFQTTAVGGVSVAGFQGGVSASAVITGDDLIDTFHTLPRSYRQTAAWLTGDTMVKMIRKLKDSEGNYLWQPGLKEGQPDRVLGRPLEVSEGAPTPAAAGKSIMFGDFSQYYIAERLGMTMQRLNELYAENGQIGFKFTKRNDGKLVDANAMVYFQHGAAS